MSNQSFNEPEEAIRLLTQANEARLQGECESSLALYLQAREQFGENADLLAVIASCYFSLAGKPTETGRNLNETVSWMERAVALRPDDARLHTMLAEYYSLALLDYERAASEYRNAIELNPTDVSALVGGAALYGVPEEVVRLDEAIIWLERVIQLEPNDPNYHFRLGDFYRLARRQDDAKREWSRALLCPRPLDPGPNNTIKASLGVQNKS